MLVSLPPTLDRAEAFEAISSLISAIVLTLEDEELKIDLQGDIAHILPSPRKARNPPLWATGSMIWLSK